MKKPLTCVGVKCMQHKCKKSALHKVAELNIWDKIRQKDEYDQFNKTHKLTTYLCSDHFNKLMDRDEVYNDIYN